MKVTSLCENISKKNNLRLNECGKLVVARDERELNILEQLLQRGIANEVPLEMVNEKEALKIEPRVKTYRQAIFSPSTATADPGEVIRAVQQDVIRAGVKIYFSNEVIEKTKYVCLLGKLILRQDMSSMQQVYMPTKWPLYLALVKGIGFCHLRVFF